MHKEVCPCRQVTLPCRSILQRLTPRRGRAGIERLHRMPHRRIARDYNDCFAGLRKAVVLARRDFAVLRRVIVLVLQVQIRVFYLLQVVFLAYLLHLFFECVVGLDHPGSAPADQQNDAYKNKQTEIADIPQLRSVACYSFIERGKQVTDICFYIHPSSIYQFSCGSPEAVRPAWYAGP